MSKPFLENIIIPEQEPTGDEHIKMLIAEIYNTSDIDLKTDLDLKQVNAITKALAFADLYNVSLLKTVANQLMRLLVSKERKGRTEFTQIATRMLADQDAPASMFDKLIGRDNS
jgi:hypothetical protein